MRLHNKLSISIALLGLVVILLMNIGVRIYSSSVLSQSDKLDKVLLVEELANHMESHITEKSLVALTISSVPLIKEGLRRSNAQYDALSPEQQKNNIDSLNKKWMTTSDSNDSFIVSHMNNPIANFLKSQQALQPGEFGEIFLTNKYGRMIATTGKLTTLAHSPKYWWKASYNEGKGKYFLDDRGFDASVEGYVLGIVIPVKENGEIIGILKCNMNLVGSLSKFVNDFHNKGIGTLQIARTNGEVVSEYHTEPLSTNVADYVFPLLKMQRSTSSIVDDKLVVTTPIKITLGNNVYGFGGKEKSIDHKKGGRGNAWHIVLTQDEDSTLAIEKHMLAFYSLFLFIFTLLIIVVVQIYGQAATKSCSYLVENINDVAEGESATELEVPNNIELGTIAKAINRMIKTIHNSHYKKVE